MTLPEAVLAAWKASPQLEAQKRLYDLSGSDLWRRFLPNEPQLQYANNDDRTSEILGLSETVAFPGKSLVFHGLDLAKRAGQRMELQARRYDLARNAVQAYLDCALSAKLAEQQRANIADLETLANSLRARYEAGMATQPEWTVIELQLRQQKSDLQAAEDKAAVAALRLARLLGMNPESLGSFDLPDDLDPSILAQLGARTSDEVRASSALGLADWNRKLSGWAQVPDLTLGVARNQYLFLPGSPNGKDLTWSFSGAVTVPVFFPFAERLEARRARSQSVLDRAAAALQAQAAQSDREDAAREYRRSRVRLKELREKDLPLAQSLVESAFSAYRAGKLGIAEVVLARKTLVDLEAQEIQLRAAIVEAHLRCPDAAGQGGTP